MAVDSIQCHKSGDSDKLRATALAFDGQTQANMSLTIQSKGFCFKFYSYSPIEYLALADEIMSAVEKQVPIYNSMAMRRAEQEGSGEAETTGA